jgi:SAM-dependent methyltransferase
MANETSKAMRRRWQETDFPWKEIFKGRGIDVGCGPDKLPFDECIPFDQGDGDANQLSKYMESESFDYLNSSHCLEHMHDPEAALHDWLKAVKSGGHVVIEVPDLFYENFQYPSVKNPDHKSSWSAVYQTSPFPIHVYLPEFYPKFTEAKVLLSRLVFRNYDWSLPREFDQTWDESRGCELWWEFVMQKL